MGKIIEMHWLENRAKYGYVTFGVPFARGEMPADKTISLTDGNRVQIPCSAEPIAYWADGTVKWMSCSADIRTDKAYVSVGNKIDTKGNSVLESVDSLFINNGIMLYEFPKSGETIMKTPYADAALKVLKESRGGGDDEYTVTTTKYTGNIESVEVERNTGLMSTVKITGTHMNAAGDKFLPFILRITIYYKEYAAHLTHTFLYDGDPSVDFIKGIGVEFTRKMQGKNYNRRTKIVGDYGVMHELVQYFNIWRPRVLRDKYPKMQIDGKTLELDENDPDTALMIKDTVVWDSYKLTQITADSFEVFKKTAGNKVTYIKSSFGHRSNGLMYLGDEVGGIAVSLDNFWQKYPSSIISDGISSDRASVTAWIVTPDAPAQDLRHYDTKAHASAHYEGFDTLGSDPYGIANTNEVTLFMFNDIPSDDEVMELSRKGGKKPVLLCRPEHYHRVEAFGKWSLISRETPLENWLEDELDKAFDFYKNEIEQRRWYGLWDYGDVMHTYDPYRHCWKYDLGGYAWQNTELVPTLWLWYAFMRSGREDIFTVAEAMCRHCADVDIYHMGELKGMGSRHNVIHWGDSCKEPRIAMAGHHRMLFYLTGGDLRIGDCINDVKDADYASLNIDPLRFFYKKEEMKLPTHARSGPDWTTYISNWFVQWERYQDEHYREKIKTSFNDLANAPLHLISGSNFEYDPATGHLGYIGESAAGGSHLAVCMGGPETGFELLKYTDDARVREYMIEYGKFYYMTPEEKREYANGLVDGEGFEYLYMAAAMAAFAAHETDDEKLAYKVWQVLIHSLAGKDKDEGFDKNIVKNYFNNENLEEMFWISTNFTAQWCLNTIVSLDFTREFMKDTKEEYEYEKWTKE